MRPPAGSDPRQARSRRHATLPRVRPLRAPRPSLWFDTSAPICIPEPPTEPAVPPSDHAYRRLPLDPTNCTYISANGLTNRRSPAYSFG